MFYIGRTGLRTQRSRFFTSTSAPPTNPSRLQRYAIRTAYTSAGLGAAWFVDRELNASAVTRNLRTLSTCATIAVDYKINFKPELSDRIPALHERVANRLYNLLISNGGLYIKIGQAIGANAALLPRPMQAKFARLFDDAPQVPYSTVFKVFTKEFGRPPAGPDGVFEIFEEEAVASASVAQVHRAKLKPSKEGEEGQWVAVKIQKPAVSKQVEWDLFGFHAVMWIYEKAFGLPVYFMADFISDHLRLELNFIREAQNAQETAAYISREPRLRGRVHVPRVYPEYSTARVMTAEWIDGVRLSDKPGMRQLMGAIGAGDEPHAYGRENVYADMHGPLRGGMKAVMRTMIDLFCAQIFDWGWVHCDPHPGNVIVRADPAHPHRPQLVLLDHGLYVRLGEMFRREYAVLWKGLLTMDQDVVSGVTRKWGFGAPDLFASATLMRPVRFGHKDSSKRKTPDEGTEEKKVNNYISGVQMKEKLRKFLSDTDKMPKELVFIGRNMRIVQGNNQSFGSPVNRIKVMGNWASRTLIASPDLTFSERLKEYWGYARFRAAMLSLDFVFNLSRFNGWLRENLFGLKRVNFEDELEMRMRGIAKDSLGIDIGPGAFSG